MKRCFEHVRRRLWPVNSRFSLLRKKILRNSGERRWRNYTATVVHPQKPHAFEKITALAASKPLSSTFLFFQRFPLRFHEQNSPRSHSHFIFSKSILFKDVQFYLMLTLLLFQIIPVLDSFCR